MIESRTPGNEKPDEGDDGQELRLLDEVEGLPEDHVFPESWYTTDTPADVEKPKAPACRPCNKRIKSVPKLR
jgi:hypothetical protein